MKRKHILIFLWLFPTITIVWFIASIPDFIANSGGYQWEIAAINDFLEKPIPVDAEMIEFDGNRGRAGYLNLSFRASNETVDNFSSHFCGGEFYQGYDPFNAIDMAEQVSDSYPIMMGEEARYYSYSHGTSDRIFGIRCLSGGKGQVQIAVDKMNVDMYSIRLEVLYNCTKCQISTPDP